MSIVDLDAKVAEFLARGGEIVRYASPQNPTKIKLGAHRKIRNLKEEAWQRELDTLRRSSVA